MLEDKDPGKRVGVTAKILVTLTQTSEKQELGTM